MLEEGLLGFVLFISELKTSILKILIINENYFYLK